MACKLRTGCFGAFLRTVPKDHLTSTDRQDAMRRKSKMGNRSILFERVKRGEKAHNNTFQECPHMRAQTTMKNKPGRPLSGKRKAFQASDG